MNSFAIADLLPAQLPAPQPTKLGVHSMNWWGDPHHPDAGFKSNDPATVARHMDMMIAAGFQYNIMNWRGATVNPTQHASVGAWIAEAERRGNLITGYPFKIAVQIDVGMFPASVNATTELLHQMTAVKSWFQSPAYLDSLVLEFGTEAVSIDWSQVKSSFPTLRFLFRNKDFLWHTKPSATQSALDILKAQYAQTPKPIMGAAYWQFDDAWPQDRSKQVWPPAANAIAMRKPNTWTPHNYGRTWFDTFAMGYPGLPYLSVVTWDDFEEGTAMAHLVAMMLGKRL